MSAKEIVIPVRLDARTFKRFGRFDAFRLRRRWVRPAVFAAILLAFAAVALASGRPQSGLIAGVLLCVGLLLPLVYIGSFFHQMNAQVKRWKLDAPRRVYTVRLDFDGVRVANDQRREDEQFVKWQDMFAAFRKPGCIYLYATTAKAYLLPSGQASVPDDALWEYVCERMEDRVKSYEL